MEALKAMKTRRSVRRFNNKKVSEELVRELLEAAMVAPSAYDHRPWQYVVLTDKKLLEEIAAIGRCSAVRNVSVAILICGDIRRGDDGFLLQSCSTATENMLIAATSLGLGAVWTSIYPFEDSMEMFQKLLNLPKDVIPLTLVPVGYSEQNFQDEEISRFDEQKVHYNGWKKLNY